MSSSTKRESVASICNAEATEVATRGVAMTASDWKPPVTRPLMNDSCHQQQTAGVIQA